MRTDIRIDGRGVSRQIVDAYGRIEGESKTAPAGNRGLTDTPIQEVVTAMDNRSNGTEESIHNSALTMLALCKQDHAKATAKRIYFSALARKHGLTNESIGNALGISEGAVRAMLARHPTALDPEWIGHAIGGDK